MTEDAKLDQKILIEQVTMLFRSTTSLLLINLSVCAALAYALWGVVPDSSIQLWVGLMLAMVAIRLVLFGIYKQRFKPENVERYRHFLVLGSASAGIAWGLAGILLFPEGQLEFQLLILFVLLAMNAGSTFSLSIYLPAFFAFSPITMLPIILKFIEEGGSTHWATALGSLCYLGALTAFNIRMNRSFEESLRLRYQNEELITQLQAQKDEADRANSAKSRFLAAASHDLRQPLYSLSLFTSVLREKTNAPETRKIADQINVSVDAMKSLFDALLDLSQLDAGAINAQKGVFGLRELFEVLANDFDPQAREKGLALSWPDSSQMIRSEPHLLEQILRNYLSNAIRFTENGSIRVECDSREHGDEKADGARQTVLIRVIDTGVGIPLEEQDEIFSEFYQLGNAERDRHKGLGLGLATVQRTAKLLDHKIAVESRPGEGSTFSVEVELAAPRVRPGQPTPEFAEPTVASESFLVAIVDDEEAIRDGLQQLLTLWGYGAVLAGDAEELLEQLRRLGRAPDALISDYRLRGGATGIEVIDRIHSTYHDAIPAIIVTGDIERDRLAEISAREFPILQKPVPPAKLRAFLRSAQTR